MPASGEWQRRVVGLYLPAFVANRVGRHPENWGGDAAGWVDVLAYADDVLLLAKSEHELYRGAQNGASGSER